VTPFTQTSRNVAKNVEHRLTLLNMPNQFFSEYFDGRIPTFEEKAAFIERAVQSSCTAKVYENDVYHVEVVPRGPYLHLRIRRHDGGACENWREFQQIKNEIVGAECEAVELFPARSQQHSPVNEHCLWVYADSRARFPLGFQLRWEQ
jgi:hypothetical protein